MIFTTRMKHVITFVLDQDSDKVTKELINLGLLHFIKVTDIKAKWNNRVADVIPEISRTRIEELKKRIESFLNVIGKTPLFEKSPDIEKFVPIDLDKTEKVMDDISDKIQAFRERQKHLQQEILKLQDIRRQVDLFSDIREGIKAHSTYSFLTIQTGSVLTSKTEDLSEALKKLPSVILKFQEEESRTNLLVITMKKDDSQVNKILETYGWLDIEINTNMVDVKGDVVTDLEAKCATLEKEQKEIDNKARSVISDQSGLLMDLWENCKLNELYFRVRSYFSKTSRTILFSGWLPATKHKIFEQSVQRVTDGRCYLEWSSPVEIEKLKTPNASIPVEIKTLKVLSPFKMLVENYAIPEYGSIDPSPFVAVAYLIMFGLMFGDIGQGMVLILAGIGGALLYKKKSSNLFNLSLLIIWCGLSAILFGVLFGSFFGMPLIKAVWFDYHSVILGHSNSTGFVKDVYGILIITIYFGIVVITVGLILNWINLIAKRRWFKLIMDKGGLLGGWIYIAGVYVAWYFSMHGFKELPDTTILFFGLGLPALLFFLKAPIEFFIHRKNDPSLKFTPMVPVDFIMEWFVEMIEIAGGYLSNTLSFMRVAGLGIAHTSLMIAFFEIAKLTGPVGGIFILILGNALVIFLEGLSSGIQSLRLNYYEFFSKYFTGTGKAYSPISLRS
ncbi:MAG: ATPase V [Spirochaetales bacterium]|nr:ATPase V [Spirochaetales bacterium]